MVRYHETHCQLKKRSGYLVLRLATKEKRVKLMILKTEDTAVTMGVVLALL